MTVVVFDAGLGCGTVTYCTCVGLYGSYCNNH